jgi:hypothetical protein
MRNAVFSILCLPLVIGCAGASGAGGYKAPGPVETASPADQQGWDPKAVELADKMLAAAGGAEAWAGVGELTFSMGIEQDGKRIATMVHHWDRATGRHRWEQEAGREPLVIVHRIDGQGQGRGYVKVEGATSRGRSGAAVGDNRKLTQIPATNYAELEPKALKQFRRDVWWLTMHYRLKAKGAQLKYGGLLEGPEGKKYETIDVKFAGEPWMPDEGFTLFVDPATNLPALMTVQEPGQTTKSAWFWEGWKEVGKLKLATVRRIYLGEGKPSSVFKKYENITASAAATDDVPYMPWAK